MDKKKLKQKLKRLFEVDLDNCKLSNEQWITWLADALTEPVKTLEIVEQMSESYENERAFNEGRLRNENAQLKHRIECIKKDMALIVSHIQSECSGAFHQPSRDVYGNVYAEQAWHNVSNIEIACDLENDESLGWGIRGRRNEPNYRELNWEYIERRCEEEGLAPGKLSEILKEETSNG